MLLNNHCSWKAPLGGNKKYVCMYVCMTSNGVSLAKNLTGWVTSHKLGMTLFCKLQTRMRSTMFIVLKNEGILGLYKVVN